MKSVIIMSPVDVAFDVDVAAAAPPSASATGADSVKGKSISKNFQWQNVEAGNQKKKHLDGKADKKYVQVKKKVVEGVWCERAERDGRLYV